MYRTENFEILIPQKKVRTYGKKDLILKEGKPIARTNEDVDFFMRIEKVWADKFKKAIEKGNSLFACPQYRLSSHNELASGQIELELGPTDYRELTGTNVEAGKNPDYMEELIQRGLKKYSDKYAYFSNTLGICSVVKTSDKKIILGLRSDTVGEYPRCWHTIGGHPNPMHYQPTKADLFDSMVREITGELGVDPDEIKNLRLIGIARNNRTKKPELLFQSKVSANFYDIKERRIKDEKDEHLTFFGIESLEELIDFLNKNQKKFTFPNNHHLSKKEQAKLKPKKKPDNTLNFLVPPGESNWVMYLKHQGINVLKELPYLEKTLERTSSIRTDFRNL